MCLAMCIILQTFFFVWDFHMFTEKHKFVCFCIIVVPWLWVSQCSMQDMKVARVLAAAIGFRALLFSVQSLSARLEHTFPIIMNPDGKCTWALREPYGPWWSHMDLDGATNPRTQAIQGQITWPGGHLHMQYLVPAFCLCTSTCCL